MKIHQWCSGCMALLLIFFLPLRAFAHSGTIPLEGSQDYKMVLLPPTLENAANPDLSDLRLTDSEGNAVPYIIYSSPTYELHQTRQYLLECTDSFEKEGWQCFDFTLAEMPSQDIQATDITFFTTEDNFVKDVRLLGGYDGLAWERVASATLYRVDGHEVLTIAFPTPAKYTHYRLEVAGAQEAVDITGGRLYYEQVYQQAAAFVQTLKPTYQTQQEGTETKVMVQGIRNLRLHELTLYTEGDFSREVKMPWGGHQSIYHLEFQGEVLTDTTLSFDSYSTPEEPMILRIKNLDDTPVKITDLSLNYFGHYLVFQGNRSGPYTLHFSGNLEDTAPRYDMEDYKDKILQQPMDTLELSALHFDETEEREIEEKDYSLLFNGVVVLLAVVLGVIIIMALRRNESITKPFEEE